MGPSRLGPLLNRPLRDKCSQQRSPSQANAGPKNQRWSRHVLHRRPDIFRESFPTPGDAGRFIGWGVVETVEGTALAAIDAVERWTELGFGVRPDFVAGGA